MSKKQFQDVLINIKDIINGADPYGLIEAGAPDDEYEDEILKIAKHIAETEDGDIQGAISFIQNIFHDNFKEEMSKEKLDFISEKIKSI